MSDELTVCEQRNDLAINRAPDVVLAEAKKAAQSLKDVIANKKKPVIFNGEQYLEFEDWQTVGRFYGVTAKVVSTEYVEFGGVIGFQARAVIIRQDGMEISAAEAMCLNDEPNWSKKPLFQLRSMAQTRACAKSLRNVLAWVVVLAGYKATPAEEMTGQEHAKPSIQKPQEKSAPSAKPTAGMLIVQTGISEISHKPTKKGGKYYSIFGVGGEIYHTFDEKKAEIATKAKDCGIPVQIQYSVDQDYGNKIDEIFGIEPLIVAKEPGSDG